MKRLNGGWIPLSAWNGKTIMTDKPSLVIESDASIRGWGASCEGAWTGSSWSSEERQWHINCLEALAAFHAVKCFVRDRKSITMLLRMDHTTAVTYVNKLGGTSLVPRPRPAFRRLQYGKAGEGLVSFLT